MSYVPGDVALPHHVRRDAGALDRGAVLRALPVGVRAVRVERVTEDARVRVRQEAVLALPTLAVLRVERVDVDVASERVERDARGRRPVAEHRLVAVREGAEEVIPLVPGPVRVDRQHGQVARPVREAELPDGLRRRRREAVVRQHALPLLERPVRAVRGLAGGHLPRERRAVVGLAGALERLPVVLLVLAVAAGVVELERHLRPRARRRDRVQRAPDEDVLRLAGGVVRDERLALRVDAEGDPLRVAVDQFRRSRGRGKDRRAENECEDEQDVPQGNPL